MLELGYQNVKPIQVGVTRETIHAIVGECIKWYNTMPEDLIIDIDEVDY